MQEFRSEGVHSAPSLAFRLPHLVLEADIEYVILGNASAQSHGAHPTHAAVVSVELLAAHTLVHTAKPAAVERWKLDSCMTQHHVLKHTNFDRFIPKILPKSREILQKS